MRNGFLALLGSLAMGTGIAFSQVPNQNPGPLPVVEIPASSWVCTSGATSPSCPCVPSSPCWDANVTAPTFWGSMEYLLWTIKDGPLPVPLVTTGNPADPVSAGALGRPGTVVLFGGSGLDYRTFSGMRVTVGSWLDDEQTIGVEASGFLLERRSVNFAARSDANGSPPLYNPVFRTDLGQEGALAHSARLARGGIV